MWEIMLNLRGAGESGFLDETGAFGCVEGRNLSPWDCLRACQPSVRGVRASDRLQLAQGPQRTHHWPDASTSPANVTKLLKLLNGCNALLVDVAHVTGSLHSSNRQNTWVVTARDAARL